MHPTHASPFTRLMLAITLLATAAHLLAADVVHGEENVGRVTVKMRNVAHISGRPTLGEVCMVEGIPEALLGRVIIHETPDRVEISDVVRLLEEAGIAEYRVLVRGPIACELEIIEPEPAAQVASANDEWSVVVAKPTPKPVEPQDTSVALRDRLRDDLAGRLNLSTQSLRLTFRPGDAALADSRTARLIALRGNASLGRVTWQVVESDQTHSLIADAAAEVEQLVLVRPIRRGQVIRAEDFEKRTVTLRRLDERSVDGAEAAGQQAARDLQVGDVLTADLLAARMLVKRGQMINVTLRRGGVELRTMARSQDDATFGQAVRARCESTGEMLRVSVTGPQAGTVLN